jgi:hypothetical protein
MKKTAVILISLACSYPSLSGLAQSAQNSAPKLYNRSELRQQIAAAHTPEQYQALARYYRQEERSFRAQQAAEKVLWEQRAQNTTSIAQKYPRPVDSAHYRYDYYGHEADRSAQQAAHYEQLAGSGTAPNSYHE